MSIPLFISIVFVAAFTQVFAGFGNALVAVPLLSLFMPLQTVVPLTILCGLVVTIFLSWRMWSCIDHRKILPLITGCIPGVVLGSFFLRYSDQKTLRLLLGVFLLLYAGYNLFTTCKVIGDLKKTWAVLAGFATGLIGAILSAGGPPTIIYTTLTGWSKNDIKATLSGFFLFTGVSIASVHFLNGITTPEVLNLFVIGAPAVGLGVWSGSMVYEKINTRQYVRILLMGLFVMGLLFLTPLAG